ncbi:uncharacterized protein HMPREF1541_02069 [Cyphellophora europaea CBS 101466]|uniref:Uncharacterized protein n=1 Tax=Cyphellophora europaea (strain CBS 101466) TaxID=1220924 RepID=W2S2I7_CYPE1|nr:uncharacterized protein HMPREF1541_02069 [Cyphellophora europaea CBS 101466]ETN42911.1 hypothetical protein HMPREF1541_02069 [Cyphellophora europaea CBS 101466]
METTISNIIDMYGGHRVEEEALLPNAHRSQAYRDTVAPLMARQYGGAQSPTLLPLFIKRESGAESPPPLPGFEDDNDAMILPPMPSPSIYQDFSPPASPDIPDMPPMSSSNRARSPSIYPQPPPLSPAGSKNGAPSFVDFARNLPHRGNDIVSPMSSNGSEEHHRQLALDSLAPPSPQDSPDVHPVAVEGDDSYLPGPISGTITQIVVMDMIAPLQELEHVSHTVSPDENAGGAPRPVSANSFEDFLEHGARRLQSQTPSLGASQVSGLATQGFLGAQRFTEEEKQQILSHASGKYPGNGSLPDALKARMSTRSSMSQRAGSLMRALSTRKGAAGAGSIHRRGASEAAATGEYVPGRKKLAIQPTSYQLYGEAAWAKDDKKKRTKNKRTSKESNKSEDGQKMGLWEGARHRLTRTASEKRREKLKSSIKLVGPTHISQRKNAQQDLMRW